MILFILKMSESKSETLDSSSSKALLYSEILNTSVTEHVQELLEKKKKGSTFPVERSSVLGRASQLLQSFKETENDVQNIEIVEEGAPVIDMSVTLIERGDECEYGSDDDARNEDFENGTKDRIILCSESDSDASENAGEAKVYDKRNMQMSSDSESRVSKNESENNAFRDMHLCSDVDIKDNEKHLMTVINCKNIMMSSDSDDNTQESETNVLKETKLFTSISNSEQFDNKIPEFVIESQNNNKCQDLDDELSNENCENQEKFLEHPKLDLELTTSILSDSKCNNQISNLDLSGEKKRKLITVIEEVDEQHTSLPTKQQRV